MSRFLPALWLSCLTGIVLSVLVFCKYRSYNRSLASSSSTARLSLQLLCLMAVADIVFLSALLFALGSQYMPSKNINIFLVNSFCKLFIFVMHVSSAVSAWCWVLLSGLRFMAVYNPLFHYHFYVEPLRLVGFVTIACCLLETWILFDVTYVKEAHGCVETFPNGLEKALQLVEILWTYFLPLSLIIVLDVKVLCFRRPTQFNEQRFQCLSNSATAESGLNAASSSDIGGDGVSSTGVSFIGGNRSPRGTIIDGVSFIGGNRSPRGTIIDGVSFIGGNRSPRGTIVDGVSFTGSNRSPRGTIVDGVSFTGSNRSPRGTIVDGVSFTGSNRSPRGTIVDGVSFTGSNRSPRGPFIQRTFPFRLMRQILFVSIIDLLMNLPNYLIRLYLNLASNEESLAQNNTFLWIHDISQFLYFAQYSMNGIYLMAINFVTPLAPRRIQTSASSVAICMQQQQLQQQKDNVSNITQNTRC